MEIGRKSMVKQCFEDADYDTCDICPVPCHNAICAGMVMGMGACTCGACAGFESSALGEMRGQEPCF